MQKNKTQSGMTLLEVLVAMTLMVIISAIAYGSLNGLIDAKIHTDAVANDIRQQWLLSQQLNKDINGMIDRKVKSEYGELQPSIIGGYTSITFTRNGHINPLRQLRSDLQRVQWYINDGQLFRRSYDLIDAGGAIEWKTRKYLDDVDELNINYINVVGQESRLWPIENNASPLKFIQFNVILNNDQVIRYQFNPLL